jgi:hypothetical protein
VSLCIDRIERRGGGRGGITVNWYHHPAPCVPTFSTQDTTQLKRAIDMTDDELAAIASRANLTVVK